MKLLPLVTAAFFLVLFSLPSVAADPRWAKKAVGFPALCFSETTNDCKSLRIPSPDGKFLIKIRYKKNSEGELQPILRVTGPDHVDATIPVLGTIWNDVLWSPDSSAFFLNGNDGVTSGVYIQVFRIRGSRVEEVDVARPIWRDMVRSFPPCKAAFALLDYCKEIVASPGYNLSGIDWLPDSSAVVIMAEIPCTSYYGGIMCQIKGYEVNVTSGNIEKVMSASEFKDQWQPSLTWDFQVPDSPKYEH